MAYQTYEVRGNNTYVYECVAYWDREKKQSRNKKKLLGRLGDNGEIVPTRKKSTRQKKTPKFKEVELISAGTCMFLDIMAQRCGVMEILKEVFPYNYKEILSCAYYFISERKALSNMEAWHEAHLLPSDKSLASQRISELLTEITRDECMEFLHKWAEKNISEDYFALDITSISSYCQANELVRYGYNRDHEKLPQINLLMVMNSNLNIPIYYEPLEGSIKDVKALSDAVKMMTFLNFLFICFVMDKGFFSKSNVDELYKESYKFLIGVPFTSSLAVSLTEKYRNQIVNFKNSIVLGKDEVIYGVTEKLTWGDHDCWWHVFFDPVRAAREQTDLIKEVNEIKINYLEAGNKTKKLKAETEKYFTIEKNEKGEEILIEKEDVIQNEIDHQCGWLVLLSNKVKTASEAIKIYRGKDPVEKCFDDLKNKLDCKRLRVHITERMESRIFIQFIALIIQQYIYTKMDETKLSNDYTLGEVMDYLKTLMRQTRIRKDGAQVVEHLRCKSAKLEKILKAFDCKDLL